MSDIYAMIDELGREMDKLRASRANSRKLISGAPILIDTITGPSYGSGEITIDYGPLWEAALEYLNARQPKDDNWTPPLDNKQ